MPLHWFRVEAPSRSCQPRRRTPQHAPELSRLAVTVGNNPLLTVVEPLRTSKLLALTLGALNTFLGAAADQLVLELGNAAHAGQDKHFDVARGVAQLSPIRGRQTGTSS